MYLFVREMSLNAFHTFNNSSISAGDVGEIGFPGDFGRPGTIGMLQG